MKRFITILLALTMLVSVALPASAIIAAEPAAAPGAVKVTPELPIYKDESYSYEERALDMVSRMTLAEKASQTAGYSAAAIPRLGIASYMWWNEALHGYSQEGWFGITSDGASYPSSYSMGASWDPDLYYQEAEQIGAEIRELVDDNKYNLTFFSPTVNLARDPRWGRNDESYGEDPLLVGLMGASYVKGVEGKNFDGTYKYTNANGEGIKQAVTTIKHYAANNSEKNRYTSGADNTTVREMREYYTRPARIVVDKADVSSVMMAYSSVAGVPISYSSYYMDTLLRQIYGFSGYIVSDCDSIATSANRNIHNTNPYTGEQYTVGEAFANAMANGLDLQCNAGETDGLGSYASNYRKMLENADGTKVQTDKGYFTEQQLEVSVARMMTKRMQLGEFDAVNDYVTEGAAREAAGIAGEYVNGVTGQTQERIDLADELSRATIVLLKNDDDTLPITESEINAADTYKVGIIGPIGQSNFRGGYSSRSSNEANLITIEQAIKTAFNDTETYAQSTIDKLEVNYHYGYSSTPSRSSFTRLNSADIAIDEVEEGLDLAIVTLGQGSGDSREDGDRTDLRLSQAQIDLLTAVKAKNPKKLVLVLETYGPIQMTEEIVGGVDAILWSSFNGFRKGTGFGEAITGKNNPSGRTNATWLKDMIGDIPGFFDYSLFPSDGEGGRTYMYNVEETIYPFGYGLSYSDVTYAPVKGSASILSASAKDSLVVGTDADPVTKDTTIDVKFQITNTNNVAGKQVAEVYVVSPGAGENDIPLKRLVGFDKVDVAANGTTEVTVPLKVTDFAFFNEEKDCYELPTGEWQIWVAQSSDLNEETDLVESFTINNGDIREDPTIVTVKPTQVGDGKENGVSERVIFNMDADASKNIILPNVAVTVANEKLYGTRVINNVPGKDLGVDPQAVTEATNKTEDGFTVPDTAGLVDRLETGKDAEDLPQVGVDLVLPDTYTITYASNRPEVVQAGSATKAGDFAEGQLVMKSAGVATITVKVTGPSGESAETEFAVCVTAPSAVKEVSIGGEAVAEIEANTKSYTCVVPAGVAASDKSLTLKVTPVEGATVEYSTTDDGTGTTGYAASANGINPTAFPCSVYVKLSGKDIVDQIIEIKYTRQFSSSYFLNGEVDEEWTIENEDAEAYEVIEGLGLRLPMQTATFAANQQWKNLFTRPIAGDWTMVTKLTFPEGFNATGQQVQILAYEDMSNLIKATFQCGSSWGFWPGFGGGGGGAAPTSTSFNMAPTVGGNSNGSISHTTTIKPTADPLVVYLKVEHQEMGLTIWYSEDGINYNQVQSADGRRAGESSYLPDAVFGLFVSGGSSGDPSKGVIVEYMDVMSMDGKVLKNEQGVLNDAFKAVADLAKTKVPTTVDGDIKLTVPADYTVTYIAEDCIDRDGTVIKPAEDKVVNTKVILSHPTAKINGNSSVTIYDGPITVKGSGEAEEYYLSNSIMNLMVGTTGSFDAIFDPTKVMSAQASAKDPSIIELDGYKVTALKKGETEIDVTFYGMPNNVELGTKTIKVYVGGAEMFDDIGGGEWFFEGVDYCVNEGLMNGTGNNLFNPNGTLTRAELVTILYRVEGSPESAYKGTFNDVPEGQWYTAAVEWAAANEIVKGIGNDKFAPGNKITREQIATILYRYETFKNGKPTVEGDLKSFPDAESVSDFAVDGMTWAITEGLINGTVSNGVTQLSPLSNATRSQIATIIMRYLDVPEEPAPEE